MRDAAKNRKIGSAIGAGVVLIGLVSAGAAAFSHIHSHREAVGDRTVQPASDPHLSLSSGQSVKQSSGKSADQSSSQSANQSSGHASVSTDASSLEPLKISDDQFGEIQLAANTVGVHQAYVPQLVNDKGLKSVQIGDRSFSLEFSHLIINESQQPLAGSGAVTGEKDVKVKDNIPAKWMEISNSAGKNRVLSFRLTDTYITITDPSSKSVSSDEIEEIASSFHSIGEPKSNSF